MKTSAPVALVSMPFARCDAPSLGLSLLKAALGQRRVEARVHYPALWLAEVLGERLYELIAESPAHDLMGEWLFRSALWGEDQPADLAFVRDVLQGGHRYHQDARKGLSPEWLERLIDSRVAVEPLLERCLGEIPWGRIQLAGFTSVFQQQVASLALAKRLKEAYPGLLIVFGGANCQAEMGRALFRNFPFVDAVCLGEGDLVFPELIERYLEGREIAGLPGVLSRGAVDGVTVEPPAPQLVLDMDALPYPDFDDYFAARDESRPEQPARLQFETSRGCWWGAKSHCTFCGLNGSEMRFREKSPERATAEIAWLQRRWGERVAVMSAADNIMPWGYFETVLPRLERLDLEVELFYETKANLKESHVALYRRAGVRTIQPGIESLSTDVLKLMGKGSSMLANVQLLKWCRAYGVLPQWNILIGFPGETAAQYAGQETLFRRLTHLPPPSGVVRIRFDRFSPYWQRPAGFGLRDFRPYPAYRYVYSPLPDEERQALAYYFVAEFDAQEQLGSYEPSLKAAVEHWETSHEDSHLFHVARDGATYVCDLRPGSSEEVRQVSGVGQILLEACHSVIGERALLAVLGEELGREVGARELEELTGPLLESGILLREGRRYLGLSLPLGPYYLPPEEARRPLEAMLDLDLAAPGFRLLEELARV